MTTGFDLAAERYDETFTFSVIGRCQRDQVRRKLLSTIRKNNVHKILEVNCGTGEDAKWLSESGLDVTATDISEKMINVASLKSGNQRLAKARLQEIHNIFADEKFNLIFSNFGGLNCLPPDAIAEFLSSAKSLLNPGGEIVLVVMPRETIWEKIYFRLKGDRASAQRRIDPATANVDGALVETHYYNPDEIKSVAAGYKAFPVIPIGLLVPPSYLEPWAAKVPLLIKLFSRIDTMLSGISGLGKYADHYFIRLKLL